jgi:transposase
LKTLYFDGTVLWLMTKRLEQGTFFWPNSAEPGQCKLKLTPEAFSLLTDGVDMHRATLQQWHERE